jgi:L,D-transpeptidase catalytic domain
LQFWGFQGFLVGGVVVGLRMVVSVLLVGGLTMGCANVPPPHPQVLPPPPRADGLPRRDVLDLAMRAWRCGREAGVSTSPLLTVIDYSLPSTERRLWVIDVQARRVLFHELVAHGEGSGENRAVSFSNRPGSRQSSIGVMRTEDTYVGSQGYSLRLTGLEPGVNDRAFERHIVMHGADYVSPQTAAALGRLGRSWGCPALPHATSRRVIDRIKGGSVVFAYYPDRAWLAQSSFLGCAAANEQGMPVGRRVAGGAAF